MKRFEQPMLGFLTRREMQAVLGQPGARWFSQRDHLLLAMLYNTGARVSEIIGVRVVGAILDGAACVHLHGKGRKLRAPTRATNRSIKQVLGYPLVKDFRQRLSKLDSKAALPLAA